MTEFPIHVTVDRLVEFHGLADALCRAELGRLPSHTTGDPVAEIILLQALQGETGAQIQAWLHDEPEAVAHRVVPEKPPVTVRAELTSTRGVSVARTRRARAPRLHALGAVMAGRAQRRRGRAS
jgi:hypothetical protein